jgi:intein-encoded DNA endonuclease-like protein
MTDSDMAIPRVSGEYMKSEDYAYIAGFLDGDGCVMLQLVRRKGSRLGYQIRASVVFYQKQQNRPFLEGLKEQILSGYVRNRNDGMSEYTIVENVAVKSLLEKLLPYLKLKRRQAELALFVIAQMPDSGRKMQARLLYNLSKEVDKFKELNYSKKRTISAESVREFLTKNNLFDPVETEP